MMINLPKPTKKELEFIKFRKIFNEEAEKAFEYPLPIHLDLMGKILFEANNYRRENKEK